MSEPDLLVCDYWTFLAPGRWPEKQIRPTGIFSFHGALGFILLDSANFPPIWRIPSSAYAFDVEAMHKDDKCCYIIFSFHVALSATFSCAFLSVLFSPSGWKWSNSFPLLGHQPRITQLFLLAVTFSLNNFGPAHLTERMRSGNLREKSFGFILLQSRKFPFSLGTFSILCTPTVHFLDVEGSSPTLLSIKRARRLNKVFDVAECRAFNCCSHANLDIDIQIAFSELSLKSQHDDKTKSLEEKQ